MNSLKPQRTDIFGTMLLFIVKAEQCEPKTEVMVKKMQMGRLYFADVRESKVSESNSHVRWHCISGHDL